MAVDLYTQFVPRDSAPQYENAHAIISYPGKVKESKRNEKVALSEKMRRKKMGHLLSTLRSLLPLPTSPKVARHCIIEETGRYIKNLERRAQELQKKKARLLATRSASLVDHNSPAATDKESVSLDVGIEVYSSETFIIRITASRMPRSLCNIYEAVEAGHGLEIERADVYKGDCIVFLYLHAEVVVSTGPNYSQEMRLKKTLENIY